MTDDVRFDALLRQVADQVPPSQPQQVNPWRKAMGYVLWGLALDVLHIQLLYLHYILPALSAVLLLLGFRMLRQANGALRLCYGLALMEALLQAMQMVLLPLPVDGALTETWLPWIGTALRLAMFIALWRGMVDVSRRAGDAAPAAPAAGAMALWYAAIIPLAYIGVEGFLAFVAAALYVVILWNMWRLTRSLADKGYVITAAPVRVRGWIVAVGYGALLAALVTVSALVGQRYRMDWQPVETPVQSDGYAQLIELGFPEAVLSDMTADETAAMAGARRVFVSEKDCYDKGAYRVTETAEFLGTAPTNPVAYLQQVRTDEDGEKAYVYHVFDVEWVHFTTVMVELADDRWVYVHHIDYRTEKSSYTSGLEIWPPDTGDRGWSHPQVTGGRVLCERDGVSLYAPFAAVGDREDTSFFDTTQTKTAAVWSDLRGGEHRRAYVVYTIQRYADGAWSGVSDAHFARQLRPAIPFADALTQWHSWSGYDRGEDYVLWQVSADTGLDPITGRETR